MATPKESAPDVDKAKKVATPKSSVPTSGSSTPGTTPSKPKKKKKQPKFTAEQVKASMDLKDGFKVDGRWKVTVKLGQGTFGAVYKCVDDTGEIEEEMALKLESTKAKSLLLKIEVAVLKQMPDCRHVCRLLGRGRNADYNFMVMSLLGQSLQGLHKKAPDKKFTLSSTIRMIFQCTKGLKEMHTHDWIHRDVKPANYALGGTPTTERTVYIFDFGLSRRFRKKGAEPRPERTNVRFRGTRRYCSIMVHKRTEMGRHDDLISVLYMAVEFIKGKLPWNSTKVDDICKHKEDTGKTIYDGLPPVFAEMHEYLHALHYNDTPNYDKLQRPLLKLIQDKKYETEAFDWETEEAKDKGNSVNNSVYERSEDGKEEDVDREAVEELPLINDKTPTTPTAKVTIEQPADKAMEDGAQKAKEGPNMEPTVYGEQKAKTGPNMEPTVYGTPAEKAKTGPNMEPTVYGTPAEKAKTGPNMEPTVYGTPAEKAKTGPSMEPTVYSAPGQKAKTGPNMEATVYQL